MTMSHAPLAQYQEFKPQPALRSAVECYWQFTAPTPENQRHHAHTVLPDGCMDLIFNLNRGSAFVVGAMTHAIVTDSLTPTSYCAIRFHPAGLRHWLKLRAVELTDRSAPADDFIPPTQLTQVIARLQDVTPQQRPAILEHLLVETMRHPPLEDHVSTAVRVLRHQAGNTDIQRLCTNLGLSRQRLACLFREHVGLSPKRLARVLRFRAIQSKATITLPDILAAGYYDQAHFINDTRKLTRTTSSTPTA